MTLITLPFEVKCISEHCFMNKSKMWTDFRDVSIPRGHQPSKSMKHDMIDTIFSEILYFYYQYSYILVSSTLNIFLQ